MSSSTGRFWSASSWKARLRRGHSNQSDASIVQDFQSAHSSDATSPAVAAEFNSGARTETQTQYSSSVYSKDNDPLSSLEINGDAESAECAHKSHSARRFPLHILPDGRQVPLETLQAEADSRQTKFHSDNVRPYAVRNDRRTLPVSSTGQLFSALDSSKSELEYSFDGILQVFVKVYAMAKVVQIILLSYGAEVCPHPIYSSRALSGGQEDCIPRPYANIFSLDQLHETEPSLLYWIKRAEEEVRSGDLAVLIATVENLHYALYSRVVIEMASVELCALFKAERQAPNGCQGLWLPDADHLYRIFLACKDTLDSPTTWKRPQWAAIHKWQEHFTGRLTEKEDDQSLKPDVVCGYRQFAQNILSDPRSAYVCKWCSLIPFFHSVPQENLISISEKWFTVRPKVILPDDVPSYELPFIDLKLVNPALWKREIVLDYRLASLANLEGKSIGDERREDPKSRLLSLAKCHKCICISTCLCARDCTDHVERPCPCSERYVRLMTARLCKKPSRFPFTTRANTAARACWEGLAMLRRDVSAETIVLEWREAFSVFELEIHKERWGNPL
ncbi:hypothetical protein PDE_04593 [Penicillium oxalicum 114-2]|uniref:Uncharacterized protein n=1 Tax=Penicillium oxalicum (strain 114-2 / CGMCC 5302) TaxID=933388 RepID=S8AU15_PENO1|nr:hypothetical protein PDE_04593 [Penicillium oxalicum 114-2]